MSPTKKDFQDGSDMPKTSGNWSEWANYVLIELKRLNSSVESLESQLSTLKIELAELKVKSSIWGAAAGAITFISFLGVNYLKGAIEHRDPVSISAPSTNIQQTPSVNGYYQFFPGTPPNTSAQTTTGTNHGSTTSSSTVSTKPTKIGTTP